MQSRYNYAKLLYSISKILNLLVKRSYRMGKNGERRQKYRQERQHSATQSFRYPAVIATRIWGKVSR